MYFDTCYIAKFYFNEPDSSRVRELVRRADAIRSSLWAFAEFHAVVHRHLREGALSPRQAREVTKRFSAHVEDGLWTLIPVTEGLLRRTGARLAAAPPDLLIRTADAIHLMTAHEAGEREVWTSDRRMLQSATHFGLLGRSV